MINNGNNAHNHNHDWYHRGDGLIRASFGLGADYIREKDGIFAILCWLSIVACTSSPSSPHSQLDHNKDVSTPLVSVEEIAKAYWKEFGRHYYTRYDYEGLQTEEADRLMDGLKASIASFQTNPECMKC